MVRTNSIKSCEQRKYLNFFRNCWDWSWLPFSGWLLFKQT